ncbi:MAG: DNA mismatch repair protein MutS [Oscillospiraceae bacterium]|nr:DNA mismatch repair protein MutS [Oscillospiraceae bacterium]
MAELTPMKRQYNALKAEYSDCLLFFRLGDFYEMFDEDARTASKELDLALTTRDRGKSAEEQTPMCGVPYHSAEAYIGRLISKGYKVAICEQLEDPALAKGLVTRDVIRIITPGTVTESSMLEEGRSNYIASVLLEGDAGAVCFADVSTGEMALSCFASAGETHILNELGRFAPREAVLSPAAAESDAVREFLTRRLDAMPEMGAARFDPESAREGLLRQFGQEKLTELGLEGEPFGVRAAGALLAYLTETQKFDLSHISGLEILRSSQYMELDYATLRSLELTQNLRSGEKRGSLLWVLDQTRTPMGGRMLRSWVERPLLNVTLIRRRLSAVNELAGNNVLRGELMHRLKDIGDMRRLAGRCVYGTANGRDVKTLGTDCALLPELKELLRDCRSGFLKEIAGMDPVSDVAELALAAICDDPPFSVREADILRPGYNAEVDRLRDVKKNGKQMVVDLGERERERTGIRKLKVGYNKVFGYYIDVPASAGDIPVPPEYIRKQTLVNAERYFTPELKELEENLLSAGDKLNELEFRLFTQVRERIAAQVVRVQAAADAVAELDCLCSLAETAVRRNYCMPEVDVSKSLHITGGRHPVVEASQRDIPFVPNDTHLSDGDDLVAIVTGPNMAGKSTYMRQTALIALMAQIGSFVPAQSATLGVVDRVFTRIGASDDLASGQSTFMVEMNEMANILKYATDRSLLILDEIGRGTSTYDGMAIARAILEYCADKRRLGAKTMFATHYHELGALEGVLPGVVNYNITAKKQGGKLIFLRKIVRGCADDSYGIEVASLAGIPEGVIHRARSYLRELEAAGAALELQPREEEQNQITLGDIGADEVRDRLRRLDVNSLTPLQALGLLDELKRMVEA